MLLYGRDKKEKSKPDNRMAVYRRLFYKLITTTIIDPYGLASALLTSVKKGVLG